MNPKLYKIREVKITRFEVIDVDGKSVANFRTRSRAKWWLQGAIAEADRLAREAGVQPPTIPARFSKRSSGK